MGMMGLPLLIAPAIGPTIGGYLVERLNWRWIFWINIPIGFLAVFFLFMQQLRGLGAIDTGILLIPEVIGAILLLPVSAVLLPQLGGPVLTIAGIAIMTIGSYPLVDLQVSTELEEVKKNLLIIGMGLGLGIMPSITLAYSSLPENLVNQGSAFLNLIRQVGSALGVAILTSVIQQRTPIYYHQLSESVTPGSNAEQYLQQLVSYFHFYTEKTFLTWN